MTPMSSVAGRYELRRLLGEGTLGRVFEARDSRSGDDVALHLLTSGSARLRAREKLQSYKVKKLRSYNVTTLQTS